MNLSRITLLSPLFFLVLGLGFDGSVSNAQDSVWQVRDSLYSGFSGKQKDYNLQLHAHFVAELTRRGLFDKEPCGLNYQERNKRTLYRFAVNGQEGLTWEMSVGTGTPQDLKKEIAKKINSSDDRFKAFYAKVTHVGIGVTEPNSSGLRSCAFVIGYRVPKDGLDAEQKQLRENVNRGVGAASAELTKQRNAYLATVNAARAKTGYRSANTKAKGHPLQPLANLSLDNDTNLRAQQFALQRAWIAGTGMQVAYEQSRVWGHNGFPFIGHYSLTDRVAPIRSAEAAAGPGEVTKTLGSEHAQGWMQSETHFRPFFDLEGFDAGNRQITKFPATGYGMAVDEDGKVHGVALFLKK